MIREIVQYGHPVLRQKCRPVTLVDESLHQLVADMLETMVDANGVGLAAPQVGVDIRLAVVDVSHDPDCVSLLKVNGEDAELASIMPLVFINPELIYRYWLNWLPICTHYMHFQARDSDIKKGHG